MREMFSPEARAALTREVFERIHRQQMAGLPLINPALEVATVGFRDWEGRTLGVLVTPWMMSLVLFPAEGEDWEDLPLGGRQIQGFPGGLFRFLVNRIDGLGTLQMHSVHSPMRSFPDQTAALAEAAAFLRRLLAPPGDEPRQELVDEELLGRILRGEKVPAVEAVADGAPIQSPESRADH